VNVRFVRQLGFMLIAALLIAVAASAPSAARAAALVPCGIDPGGDPCEAIISVSSGGAFVAPGSTFNVGSTVVNTPKDQVFVIRNEGNLFLSISNVTVSGEGFSLLQAPSSPIQPGRTSSFTVRLLSATAGTKSGSVSISSNASFDNPYTFSLSGQVQAATPQLQVISQDGVTLPNNSTYGYPGTPRHVGVTRCFTIYSTGNATLTISNFALVRNTTISSEGFTVISAPATSIPPGGSSNFCIELKSGTAGQKTGQVIFRPNVTGQNPYRITLSGTVT
jgi:hypothetical protein